MKQNYTNIHCIDNFRVNINSKQSVIEEYPCNVPHASQNSNNSWGLSTATIEYSSPSVCLCVCLCTR